MFNDFLDRFRKALDGSDHDKVFYNKSLLELYFCFSRALSDYCQRHGYFKLDDIPMQDRKLYVESISAFWKLTFIIVTHQLALDVNIPDMDESEQEKFKQFLKTMYDDVETKRKEMLRTSQNLMGKCNHE